MGTAGITYFHENKRDSKVLCAVYKQSDGYPSSCGNQIRDYLGHLVYVNGLLQRKDVVCGMGCAAAQFIAAMKHRAGGIYMVAPDANYADFEYHVFFDGNATSPGENAKLSMSVTSSDGEIWSGLLCDFDGDAVENQDDDD
jgi:hypothetical protein